MKSIAPNPKYLYDARFRKVEPRKIDKIRDTHTKVSLHTHSKRNNNVENTFEQLDDLVFYCLQNSIRVCAITDHEKDNINQFNYSGTDQRFGQLSPGKRGKHSWELVGWNERAKTLATIPFYKNTLSGRSITFPKSKEFWAKGSDGNPVHVLVIGYKGEIECNRNYPVDYLIKRVKDENKGIVIAAHPFNKRARGISKKDLEGLLASPDTKPDALEVNSMNVSLLNYFNKKTINFGRKYKIPLIAGSDAHFNYHIEFAHILIQEGYFPFGANDTVVPFLSAAIKGENYYNYFQPIPLTDFLKWWAPMQLEYLPGKIKNLADKVRA